MFFLNLSLIIDDVQFSESVCESLVQSAPHIILAVVGFLLSNENYVFWIQLHILDNYLLNHLSRR